MELRCDLLGCDTCGVRHLTEGARRAIITCHNSADSKSVYMAAIEAGCWAVDVDTERAATSLREVVEMAKGRGVRVILSRHFDYTPTPEELQHHTHTAFEMGADIAKIITTATTTAEALVPLTLYRKEWSGSVVAFAMGEAGRFSRRLSLLLGAPYTYVCHPSKGATAVGQPTREELEGSLECDFSLDGLHLPASVTPPSSKSEAQRTIILAMLAEGTSHIHGYTPCGDSEAALALVRALGAEVSVRGSDIRIEGLGRDGLRRAIGRCGVISVGESALLARLMLPIVATLLPEGASCTIEGEGTLPRRNLALDFELLRSMGAQLTSLKAEGRLPVRIDAGAREDIQRVEIDGSHSSQTTSGWLVALALTTPKAEIGVRGATSRPYIDLTAEMLTRFGAKVEITDGERLHIALRGGELRSAEMSLRGDWSSAAYFAAAYAIAESGPAVREEYSVRCERESHQPDEQIIDLLRTIGARVEVEGEVVRFLPSGPLRGFCFDATDCPDLLPTLAIVALYAVGTSRLRGASRLTNKESNRLESLVEGLVAMGASVWIEDDEVIIEGGSKLHAAPLLTHSDHRMAMALTIAALFMSERPRLDSGACVSKSFGDFFEILGR